MRLSISSVLCLLTFSLPAAAERKPPAAAHAERMVAAIASEVRNIRGELRQARDRSQTARARCLSGKLSELHAQQRQAKERSAELVAALARGDAKKVSQNRVVLSSLAARARVLSRQARRGCV